MDCLQKCHSRVCFSISNNFTLSFFLLTYPASCVQSDEPCRWASIWPLPSCPSLVSHPPLPLSLSLSCDIEEMRWMGSMSNPAWGAAMDLLRWLCAITLHLRCWLEQAHRLSILNHGDFVITSISWRRDLWGVAEVGDMVAGGDDATDGASLILKSGRWWGDVVAAMENSGVKRWERREYYCPLRLKYLTVVLLWAGDIYNVIFRIWYFVVAFIKKVGHFAMAYMTPIFPSLLLLMDTDILGWLASFTEKTFEISPITQMNLTCQGIGLLL